MLKVLVCCRTEHMFFDTDRIVAMREMIMAADTAGRTATLDKLLPYQRQDFAELFTIMAGLPVTIRLLDPHLCMNSCHMARLNWLKWQHQRAFR